MKKMAQKRHVYDDVLLYTQLYNYCNTLVFVWKVRWYVVGSLGGRSVMNCLAPIGALVIL